MARHCSFSLFMLHIILLSLSVATTQGNNDVITRACSKAAAERQVDPAFCNKVLRADPRSAKADLKGLGIISFDIASSKADKTYVLLYSLLKSTTDHQLETRYHSCAMNYKECLQLVALGKDDISGGRFRASQVRANAARNFGPDKCVEGFQGPPAAPPELQQANKEIKDLCNIAFAIGALLDGK